MEMSLVSPKYNCGKFAIQNLVCCCGFRFHISVTASECCTMNERWGSFRIGWKKIVRQSQPLYQPQRLSKIVKNRPIIQNVDFLTILSLRKQAGKRRREVHREHKMATVTVCTVCRTKPMQPQTCLPSWNKYIRSVKILYFINTH